MSSRTRDVGGARMSCIETRSTHVDNLDTYPHGVDKTFIKPLLRLLRLLLSFKTYKAKPPRGPVWLVSDFGVS